MLLRWTEQPTLARTIAACLSFSLALICKLSIVPFTVAVAGLWLLRRWSTSGSLKEALRIPIRIKHLALGMALGFLLVWSAYGFRSESLSAARTVRNFQATLDTSSLPKRVFSALLDVPIPAGNMIRGFGDLLLSEHGQIIPQYFRGEVKEDGWLLYFPIAFAIKIPLSLAIMGALALYFAIRQRNAAAYYPLGVALMIFLICLPTRWNVGTRYLLAIFPLIAIASGVVIQTLWMARKNTWAARGVLLALIGWLATDSIRAHPDYLPYFNPLAGAHPEAILVECDLDWGQDFYRLQDTLPSLEPRPLYLDYYGSTPPEIYGVKEYTHVPEQPVSGWVAVSIRNMVFFPEKYAWLESYPWRTLGKTIRLYDTGTLHDAPYTAPANRIEAMTRLQLR
jgi:hypothetical protein